MSRRAQLYRVVRDLKSYLRWQQASGAAGSVPAPAEAREAFEAKKEAREKAKIERMTRKLREGVGASDQDARDSDSGARSGEPGRDARNQKKAGRGAEAPNEEPPNKQASNEQAPDEQAPKESGKPSFNPFGADKKKTPETPANSSAGSSPWKNGVGSRPTRRFGGKNKPKSPEQASGKATQQQKTPPRKSTSTSSKSSSNRSTSNNSPPPVDYDAYYPEASGMADPEGYDPSREPEQPASAAPTPKKDPAKMNNAEKLEFLQEYMGDCKRCGLCEHRTNIAFGVGDPEAKLVFVGEAPGYNEDQQGEPFVGKAGQLLDKMIEAMGLEREDVYICNVIKCRPPDNRNPHPDEIRECSPFLRKQLGVIEPTVIVTLGKFASQFLTGEDGTMGSMRGRWHDWEGIPVMPTYHPAYLLRSEEQKGKTWNDLQMVMERLGL